MVGRVLLPACEWAMVIHQLYGLWKDVRFCRFAWHRTKDAASEPRLEPHRATRTIFLINEGELDACTRATK